jgi:hypothetical protein
MYRNIVSDIGKIYSTRGEGDISLHGPYKRLRIRTRQNEYQFWSTPEPEKLVLVM